MRGGGGEVPDGTQVATRKGVDVWGREENQAEGENGGRIFRGAIEGVGVDRGLPHHGTVGDQVASKTADGSIEL